jgi:streptogramin lyase
MREQTTIHLSKVLFKGIGIDNDLDVPNYKCLKPIQLDMQKIIAGNKFYPENLSDLCFLFFYYLQLISVCVLCLCLNGGRVQGYVIFEGSRKKIWTDTPDWQSGHQHEHVSWTQVAGQIQLDVTKSTKVYSTPYIYIPNSGSNNVTQLDTRTGQRLWTLSLQKTADDGDPSRTTVDANGHVWVGLRRTDKVVQISKDGHILRTITSGSIPRAITIDLEGNIWVGNWGDHSLVKIDAESGKRLLLLSTKCPYGATTDIHGNIWVLSRCDQQQLTKFSRDGQALRVLPTPQAYGIASDAKGQIWVAHFSQGCVYRFNNEGHNLGCIKLGYGCQNARGVAVDGDNNIWVVCSNTPVVVKLSDEGKILGANTEVGAGCVGLAVDANGFVWVISRIDNTAAKINSKTMKLVGKYKTYGESPYTYSDMTGFQFQSIAQSSSGYWRARFAAPCVAHWKSIRWNSRTPSGTSIGVRVRSAATHGALEKAAWRTMLNSGDKPSIPDNPWIEIEVTMQTFDRKVTPVLFDLIAEYLPVGIENCNGLDDDCDGVIDNIPGTNRPLYHTCSTACGQGIQICQNGAWQPCSTAMPMPEVCNGLDDNCDGKIDEGAICPDQHLCIQGHCVQTCALPCPDHTICQEIDGHQICVGKQSCDTLSPECEKQGLICRHGRCIEPCAGIVCPPDYFCTQHQCQPDNCHHPLKPCPQGEICREAKCLPDPCRSIQCPSHQACKQGRCVDSCADLQCPAYHSCRDGKCLADDCADIRCPPGGICLKGQCFQDPCPQMSCSPGKVCFAGQCQLDPCISTNCPDGQICRPPHGDCYHRPHGRPSSDYAELPIDEIPWSTPIFDGGNLPQPDVAEVISPDQSLSFSDPHAEYHPSSRSPLNACHCMLSNTRSDLSSPILIVVFGMLFFALYTSLRPK